MNLTPRPSILSIWLLLFLWALSPSAQEDARPTFLFPSAAQPAPAPTADLRRSELRQEGETALAMHAPDLAEEKLLEYCNLTPADLAEAGAARRLLAEAQFAYAENLLAQGKTEEAAKKFQDVLQTVETYLALPDIHPGADEIERLYLLQAQALIRLERPDDALKLLLTPERALTSNAQDSPVRWEALRLASRLHLARREWSAALGLLEPYFSAVVPTRKDAELIMLRADAELGRGDYAAAAEHYAQLIELLPKGDKHPGEMPDLETLAQLHRIRALIGTCDALVPEARLERLNEARAITRRLASQKPENRNAEWGDAFWYLANEYVRNVNDPSFVQSPLQEAWEILPYSDPHWVEAGMLLAQAQRQQKDPLAKNTLEELRNRRPDSPKYGEFSLQLAEYRKEDNDRTRAAEIFVELATRDDIDPAQRARAAFGAAECLALEGKLDQALVFYRQSADNSNDPRQAVTALLHSAQAAQNAGNLELAIALQVETADRFGKKPENGDETDDARKLRLRAAEARLEAALLCRQDAKEEAYTRAIALLDGFLQDAPDSTRRDEARLEKNLIQCLLAAQNSELLADAQNAFRQLANDTSVEERLRTIAFFEAARIALRKQDLETAGSILDDFLATYPQSTYALRAAHRRVLLAMQLGQKETANELASSLLQKWPGTSEAAQLTLLLADTALSTATTQGYQEALRLYRQVRSPAYSDESAIAQAHFESANCLFLMALQNHPEEFFAAAPASGDATPKPQPTPREAQEQLIAQAIAELEAFNSAAAPTLTPQVWMLHGELLALAGHPAEAREKFRLVRENSGNTILGFAALGRMAEMLIAEAGNAEGAQSNEKLQEAINTLAHILANAKQDELLAMAHFRTAQCLRELGHYRDAGKNYEDALRHYKEICVDFESSSTPERSPRYYTLAVFELADLADEMADPTFLEQAAQFLTAYSQHREFPLAERAQQRASELHQYAQRLK